QIRLSDVTDGTSNTIFIVDAADDHAVTWTKPDDLRFDPGKPLAGLVGHHRGVFAVAFADGSIHLVRDTISAKTLNALLTRNGNEIIQYEEFPQRTGPQPAQKPVARATASGKAKPPSQKAGDTDQAPVAQPAPPEMVPPFEEIPLQSTFESRIFDFPEEIANR